MYSVNQAHNVNFFKAWTRIPDNTFDLCVTSPPYYNARKYGGEWDYFKSALDWQMFCIDMLMIVSEVMKPEGIIWWNTGPGYEDGKRLTVVERLIIAAEDEGIHMITKIPWIKTSFLPKTYQNRPYAAWEENIIFSKSPKLANYYVDHVREPYAESTLKRLKYPVGQLQADEKGEFKKRKMVKPNPLGKAPPDYLQGKVDTSKRDHPAPMAKWLANWAIRAYSKEGDYVLDPMCGIGTTLVEGIKLGRNVVGFDANDEYVGKANEALNELALSWHE
jgi:site-specific DNA-methyltransferase (adenine-specific)